VFGEFTPVRFVVTNCIRLTRLVADMHQNGDVVRVQFVNDRQSDLMSDVFRERDVQNVRPAVQAVVVVSRLRWSLNDDFVVGCEILKNSTVRVRGSTEPVDVFRVEIARCNCGLVVAEDFPEFAFDQPTLGPINVWWLKSLSVSE
jgi:hypothetical protein